jgi:Mg2+/Co2+ transporter CorB
LRISRRVAGADAAVKVLLLPFLFLLSAFFSATETALFALRRLDLLRMKEAGDRRAARIERMLSTPSRLISTIFLGNEIVNVAISSVIAAILLPRLPPVYGEAAALAAGTLGILLLGDVTPKCLVWPRAKASPSSPPRRWPPSPAWSRPPGSSSSGSRGESSS